jgi:hypothetical protein
MDQMEIAVKAEAKVRQQRGERFVIPVTAVIETGNHIANVKSGDRRGAADRFVRLLRAVRDGVQHWVLHEVEWDGAFLDDFCAGSVTKQPFLDLAGNGQLGGGDVAILVERERYRARSAFKTVQIWTLDDGLRSYG